MGFIKRLSGKYHCPEFTTNTVCEKSCTSNFFNSITLYSMHKGALVVKAMI